MKRRAGLAAAVIALAVSMPGFAQGVRTTLPVPSVPFAGSVKENVLDSTPTPPQPVRAPAGAPNILLFMSDDVGFSMSSTFGGPVPTPNMARLAASGQRYNRFHTTGICSPTRAALLTGRNHHAVGVGYLSDLPTGFPGYGAHIPASASTIAQTLRLNGYNTAMFGKHHNVPTGEESAAGPFDQWPTGLGFEYFYGFIGGDTDQYQPRLFRGTSRLPDQPQPGALLERRLADDAIGWIHNQKAAAPDKPFFVYYAPGSLHAPHQAPADYIDRFKGKFDRGWDVERDETYRRQLAGGIIPPGTNLTARPDGIPAWDSLSAQQKIFAARSMEVAAGMLAYQDAQLGRVMDELQRMGVLDNTLVAVIEGDNGAATEVGPRGTINELGNINGLVEDDAWLAANAKQLGGPMTYPTYPAGWALAMNTPLRWTKQYASMLGAVRNGMILSWKGHVAAPDGICARFSHVVDIAPTLLEASGIPAPETVYGVKQQPTDGRSLISSLATCQPDAPRSQYFEIGGKIGLYDNGWFASNDDGRKPWEASPSSGVRPETRWTLYDLRNDFSQSTDVSARYPDRLQQMIALWQDVAAKNNVYPLDHRFGPARGAGMMQPGGKRYEYWGKDVSVLAIRDPNFAGRSFTLTAQVRLDGPQGSGVVVALGSHFAGWSLYLDKGRPTFTYARSTKPEDIVTITARQRLPKGASTLRMTLTSQGIRGRAHVAISSGDTVVAQGDVPRTFVLPAGLGETLDIGRDTGVTVTGYRSPHGDIEGDVPHVAIDFTANPKH